LLDTDNDGQINGDDLKRGIALFGNNVSEEEIQEMLHSADIDGDELINYEEFLKIMVNN
jgi:calmodulin